MAIPRLITTALLLAATFAAGVQAEKLGMLKPSHTSYLQLTAPLTLSTDNAGGTLPAGTALYQDQAFAEGHVRYIVYVNVKGPLPAQRIRSDKRNLIDPLWGAVPD